MTPNGSLELSIRIRDIMKQDILQFIDPIFPFEAIRSYEPKSEIRHRDRVFNSESTLLTMIITALKDDRSLQNSVRIFQEIFHKNREATLQTALEAQHKVQQDTVSIKANSRLQSNHKIRIPISKMKDVSSNTAAYSKARERIEQELIDKVFKASTDFDLNGVHKWYGRSVFNTDGTYFQMQDTPEIPEKYRVQKNTDGTPQGYPQGLLQTLTQHGTGLISSYCIAGRSQSELDVIVDMLDPLPENSLILADDLYNCYSLFCLLMNKGIDIIVPDKKDRPYRVIKKIAPGDEIVEIDKPHHKIRMLVPNQVLPCKITLRRISYRDSAHPKENRTLLTTILDESIERQEFIHQFSHRWDIEITIREIKTIMGINIARSKTEGMVFREIGVALLAYNLVRKIVAKSVEQTPFSPETDIFQELYSTYTPTLVDRKGRVYSRWSPGRPPSDHLQIEGEQSSASTGKTVSKEN